MANLEDELGVPIWDRSTKTPKLTDAGKTLLAATHRVLEEVEALSLLAKALEGGIEAKVLLCVDALFPQDILVNVFIAFARQFPTVELRIDTQLLGVVGKHVEEGRATIGLVGPLGTRVNLARRILSSLRMIPVVAPSHPLAAFVGAIPTKDFADHVQVVLSERGNEGVPDQGVLSPRTWRVTELSAKHEMLRAGLGWGNLPEPVVRADLVSGRLVAIQPAAWHPEEHVLRLSAVYRDDVELGPAHRWLLDELEACCKEAASPAPTTRLAIVPGNTTTRRKPRR